MEQRVSHMHGGWATPLQCTPIQELLKAMDKRMAPTAASELLRDLLKVQRSVPFLLLLPSHARAYAYPYDRTAS